MNLKPMLDEISTWNVDMSKLNNDQKLFLLGASYGSMCGTRDAYESLAVRALSILKHDSSCPHIVSLVEALRSTLAEGQIKLSRAEGIICADLTKLEKSLGDVLPLAGRIRLLDIG